MATGEVHDLLQPPPSDGEEEQDQREVERAEAFQPLPWPRC
jgi:hypothetical protein